MNQKRNLTFARNVALNRDRNVRIVNHWRNDRFRGGDYAAFYNYNRVWHDRSWWVSSYPHVVFVLGGWWYWNTGYWYPAWGYEPYASYSYDGPIYTGYADWTPDRIIEDVQLALQQQGLRRSNRWTPGTANTRSLGGLPIRQWLGDYFGCR